MSVSTQSAIRRVFMRPATPLIRLAAAPDQPRILSLSRGERTTPTRRHWPKFVVGDDGGEIIGAVQLRSHPDGSGEMGSLVVAPACRGRGIAAQLIDRRLADAS